LKKNKVIGLIGSIRSNFRHLELLKQYILDSNNKNELKKKIESSKVLYSNTDISLAFSLLGAKTYAKEIEIFSLINLFKKMDKSLYSLKSNNKKEISSLDTLSVNNENLENLLQIIDDSSGIVLGTPVYFGDRSSVANKILQLTNKNKLLKNKAFGCVSVGAKRNGGQETAIIYSLFEALVQDAIVIGNGPKTCQYGGTVVAGDMHQAWQDKPGMETCF